MSGQEVRRNREKQGQIMTNLTLDDVLDIRDLADEFQAALDEIAEDPGDEEVAETIAALSGLCEQLDIGATPDELRRYGDQQEPTLVRDDAFEDYAQQLAEDICPFPSNSPEGEVLSMWPYRHVDWERAAEELRADYTTIRLDGVDYLIRAS